MVQRDVDPLTGASRGDILISAEDLRRLGLNEGDLVRLRSGAGTFSGTLRIAAIKPGNLQVHWPEANALLSTAVDAESLEPDYNATVLIERS
jgi:anaerobic selenocysteine-containing dehydrogenase